MLEDKISDEMLDELYEAFVSLENKEDCRDLLEDLCTKKEIANMAQRMRAAKLLTEGKTYTDVIGETDISSATLSRVSRALRYGVGYKKQFGKVNK